jgi:hypothetical protein
MTKDDFRERCAAAEHVRGIEQHPPPGLDACANCLTYARRDGAGIATIMRASPGFSSPAEMRTNAERSWVCESHFAGVIHETRESRSPTA